MNSVKIMTLAGMMFLAVISYSTASEVRVKKFSITREKLKEHRVRISSKSMYGKAFNNWIYR